MQPTNDTNRREHRKRISCSLLLSYETVTSEEPSRQTTVDLPENGMVGQYSVRKADIELSKFENYPCVFQREVPYTTLNAYQFTSIRNMVGVYTSCTLASLQNN
jgi:hypothetical protein